METIFYIFLTIAALSTIAGFTLKKDVSQTASFAIGTIFAILALYVNNHIPKKIFVDLPEEISQAEVGDLLQVESTVGDSIKLGFARNRTEYMIELIDEYYVKIDNGVEFRIIPFDSINAYIEKDNE